MKNDSPRTLNCLARCRSLTLFALVILLNSIFYNYESYAKTADNQLNYIFQQNIAALTAQRRGVLGWTCDEYRKHVYGLAMPFLSMIRLSPELDDLLDGIERQIKDYCDQVASEQTKECESKYRAMEPLISEWNVLYGEYLMLPLDTLEACSGLAVVGSFLNLAKIHGLLGITVTHPGLIALMAAILAAIFLNAARNADKLKRCPPCPFSPAPEIDRVPPSRPHWPCKGDHWHYRVYNMDFFCNCHLSSRLFGGCCGALPSTNDPRVWPPIC